MDESSLLQRKRQLKHKLLLERQKLYGRRFLPQCAYCGQGILGSPDMHEVFFTKGDLQGVDRLAHLIYHRCNCVLVHPGGNTSACHAGAATRAGQGLAARQLIRYESLVSVRDYILMVAGQIKNKGLAEQALRLIGGEDAL